MATSITYNPFRAQSMEPSRRAREIHIRHQAKAAYIIGIICLVAAYFFRSWVTATFAVLWLLMPWDSFMRDSDQSVLEPAYNSILHLGEIFNLANSSQVM